MTVPRQLCRQPDAHMTPRLAFLLLFLCFLLLQCDPPLFLFSVMIGSLFFDCGAFDLSQLSV
jgi:hypothetical protein